MLAWFESCCRVLQTCRSLANVSLSALTTAGSVTLQSNPVLSFVGDAVVALCDWRRVCVSECSSCQFDFAIALDQLFEHVSNFVTVIFLLTIGQYDCVKFGPWEYSAFVVANCERESSCRELESECN